ncbi:uncharacterized protein LOC134186980 [Corticium candelabrum]|uniref:uncharacterized protein LOC134186980 n=1 Tax=Corticium candelabrum TaxID=121492 RepID=UPI002E26E3A9|nr:uncharacterized protein LOC134186980 [Corticium candelabrum]
MTLQSITGLFLLCFLCVHSWSTSLPSKGLIEDQNEDKEKSISISFVRANWDGYQTKVVPNLGYRGNANFDLPATTYDGNRLVLYFASRYEKEPAFCKWQFEGSDYADTIYYYRLGTYRDRVTIDLFAYSSKVRSVEKIDWTSMETDFSVICYNGAPISVYKSG